MSAALKRKLADISNAEASAFLNKDLLKTMHTVRTSGGQTYRVYPQVPERTESG